MMLQSYNYYITLTLQNEFIFIIYAIFCYYVKYFTIFVGKIHLLVMVKKITWLVCLACWLMAPAMKAQVSFGKAEKFNDDWKFILKDDPSMVKNDFDDSKWRKLDLPHDWSVEGQLSPTLASCTGYLPAGIAWYRKTFEVKDDAKRHYIYFEGVYNRSEVYLNGQLLGKRPNGYVSFMYDLTPYLKEGENVLAVRVDHSRYADSRWYTGSGIYRDVWMIASGDTHFAQWGIGWYATSITKNQATVAVDVEIEKHTADAEKLEVRATMFDADGKQVAKRSMTVGKAGQGITKKSLSLKVAKPHRWDLDTPYLYTLKTELYSNGQCIDASETRVGLRTLQFDANKGFALNGNWMKVKGVCLHHDAGVLGAVVPRDVWKRRLENLKAIGTNAIRMSHNPQAPVLYDLCDELGFLVMDEVSDEWEFPKRKWVEGWNVGTPSYDGTFDFFEEWIERDITDMVRRDRNHTSIFLWSVGNEVDYPNDPYSHPILDGDGAAINQPMFGGYKPDAPNAERIGKIAKRLAACIRAVDTSRPVTGALAGVVMSNQTEYPEAVDVVGYNYTENRYDEDHATYPNRIIYGSETSVSLNSWYAVKNKEFIFGQFLWTGTDYLGESGRWPSRGLYTGLLDFGSFPKPRGWFRASLWSDKPVTYIGTYPMHPRMKQMGRRALSTDAWDIWNYEEGQEIRVVCYTNAPQARLLLDGKVVGEMKPYDEETGVIYWDIPYQAGELKAEGCDASGKVLSHYIIRSSERPYAIRVQADRYTLSQEPGVAHLTVEVVDEHGAVVKLADNEITCRVEGPARLLGLEGSNNRDMSDYTDNSHRVYHGRLLAYIQTTGEEGKITVKFTSPLLKGTEVVLDVTKDGMHEDVQPVWIPNGDRQIYGELFRPAHKEGKMPIAIIAHGFNGTYHHGRNYFETLKQLGYMCYTFDFPCGSVNSKSDNNTMNMSLMDERNDLIAIVNYFKNHPDVDASRIVLIGESQGGLASVLASAAMPEEVSQLVLIFPAICIPDNWNQRYPNVSDIPEVTKLWNVPMGRRFFMEIRDLDPFKEMTKFEKPVLIVQGDKDPVVSMEDSQRAVGLYKNARLHVIPGAGHGFKPAEFTESMEQLKAFLK